MYNFLNPKLLPKVTTKCSAMDRYEIENLISSNFLIKSRGFIAYTTMKPPIDIDFQLICNVSLAYILINSKIGSHKCSSIEVMVKNASSQFVSISKAIYEENGVVFCNSKYYSKDKPPVFQNDYHLSYFKSNEFRSFLNADTVRIRILNTRGTVPCLANVEVWGSISKGCSQETAKTVNKLMSKNNEFILTSNKNTSKTINEEFKIPDDFLDALTYELMAIPMTLPSGHTIDQSTLEKCLGTDVSCGRHGCDPFTGLKYTENRKPVLNVALKTRIDMFLLENSHKPEIYGIGRTVGKNVKYQMPQTNSRYNLIEDYSDISHASKKIKLDGGSSVNLDDAIKNVLNEKDFVRFTAEEVSEKESVNNVCNFCCISKENLYILPCKHLYCRNCLLTIKNKSRCKACDVEFFKKDLQRYHCLL